MVTYRIHHYSLSKPATEHRDEASPVEPDVSTRSPSPVINSDSLKRPSRGTRERLEKLLEQAADRLSRIFGGLRKILKCFREGPSREGLLGTPERYAKAMLVFTKGDQDNFRDILNNAVFHEAHNELVIMKNIDFSLWGRRTLDIFLTET